MIMGLPLLVIRDFIRGKQNGYILGADLGQFIQDLKVAYISLPHPFLPFWGELGWEKATGSNSPLRAFVNEDGFEPRCPGF